MRKILLALGIMALICTPAMAGPNANGAIIVHTNDTYNFSAGTVCTTTLGQPLTCQEAVTTSARCGDGGGLPANITTIWFMAAFLPSAMPAVASVYFGTNVDEANLDAGTRFGYCGPANTVQDVSATWPYNGGASVGFGTAITGSTLFRFYYFGVENIECDPAAPNPWWCSGINPIGGYAAFYDTSFPPIQDTITQFGCLNWYDAGHNDCPQIVLPSGACCLTNGECLYLTEAACLVEPLYLEWRGEGTTCTPDNPCEQPGACCDLETGACTFVLPRFCQAPLQFVGGTCAPVNPCPQKGACCEPLTGNCTYVLQAECLAPSVWHGEWTCDPNNCPVEPRGACCAPNGGCTLTYAAECLAPSIWHPEWTCDPNNCPPPVPTEPTTWGKIKANYR